MDTYSLIDIAGDIKVTKSAIFLSLVTQNPAEHSITKADENDLTHYYTCLCKSCANVLPAPDGCQKYKVRKVHLVDDDFTDDQMT